MDQQTHDALKAALQAAEITDTETARLIAALPDRATRPGKPATERLNRLLTANRITRELLRGLLDLEAGAKEFARYEIEEARADLDALRESPVNR